MFEKGNLKIKSDFDIRIIKEMDNDIDLFIDLNYRSLNLNIGSNNLNISRLQFPMARGLVARFNEYGYEMTIHILRDIDLHSAFANFEINYKESIITIESMNEQVEIKKVDA